MSAPGCTSGRLAASGTAAARASSFAPSTESAHAAVLFPSGIEAACASCSVGACAAAAAVFEPAGGVAAVPAVLFSAAAHRASLWLCSRVLSAMLLMLLRVSDVKLNCRTAAVDGSFGPVCADTTCAYSKVDQSLPHFHASIPIMTAQMIWLQSCVVAQVAFLRLHQGSKQAVPGPAMNGAAGFAC